MNQQLPHLFHQLVQSNSFASKCELLLLTLPMALNDIPNKGQQVSGQTRIQVCILALAAGRNTVLGRSLTGAPALDQLL